MATRFALAMLFPDVDLLAFVCEFPYMGSHLVFVDDPGTLFFLLKTVMQIAAIKAKPAAPPAAPPMTAFLLYPSYVWKPFSSA